jgi:tyrosine-specific transport protein
MFKLFDQKTWGSLFMIVGTAIGAGMLALPMVTSEIGFYYAILIFIAGYLFMLLSSYLLAEANFYSTVKHANIITLARERLGIVGRASAWIFFLLLLYAVAAAYMSAGGALMGNVFQSHIWSQTPTWVGMFVFIVSFGVIVVFGMRFIDVLTRILIAGLVGAFVYLLFFISPEVDTSHFAVGEAVYIWAIIPVVILSFTSGIIIPSLKSYLNDDVKKLSQVIWIGNLIPLIFYILWEIMIMGVLPLHGEQSLATIEHSEHPVNALTNALQAYSGTSGIATAVELFSFCALVTSFLAVSFALVDFLSDGLGIKKTVLGRIYLVALSLTPPLLFALFFPKGFLIALGYAGVFVAILYGILPALMVWKARYRDNAKGPIRVFGGKPLLCMMISVSIVVIFAQIGATLGLLPM